ncbi:sugar ABC transporter permease [Staphylococcus felis]|uniref:sugar ABC transporter permease n=2 Tax=Staphylococcus felis TaxID=46127 RepID=UPI000E27DEC7|nr:sugar ABC transporter permease [Staphylococcus felis]REH94799.1 sugar ABC transporter permease [Staphylococcus felis]REI05733.1 sugar ABC transporter permease [Staphylococcus felis]REI35275.1 sugar ABC transporter permease [Staphylococcus felis]
MKNKWITLVLSFILPGIGHLYLRDLKFGITYIIVSLLSISLSEIVHPIFGFIYFILWIYTMAISFKITRNFNQRN